METAGDQDKAPPGFKVLVLAIGEAHHLMHILGPARELFRSGIKTDILVSTHWHEQLIADHAPELTGCIQRTALFYDGKPLHQCPPRLPNLLLGLGALTRYHAILTPERTSTALKKLLGKRCPKLIHIPHGAGDRAQGYEDRIRLFDLVLVAGEKDYNAFLLHGLATAENCFVIGYCKFDVLPKRLPRFFENDRPIVLYNPHFDMHLGSWLNFGPELVNAFTGMREYNLIIAPHLRLRGKGRRLLRRLSQSCHAPNVLFDGGSLHSINMDYTRSASIYLGDVSSQVYEFLQTPRPCVFLNAHEAAWNGNAFYRHWSYGEVADTATDAIAAIRSAATRHDMYRPLQTAGFSDAVAAGSISASQRAVALILQFLKAGNMPVN